MKVPASTIVEQILSFSNRVVSEQDKQALRFETLSFLKRSLEADDVELTLCSDPHWNTDLITDVVNCQHGEVLEVYGSCLTTSYVPSAIRAGGFACSANLFVQNVGVFSVLYRDPRKLTVNDHELFQLAAGLSGALDVQLQEQAQIKNSSEVASYILNTMGQGVTMVNASAQFSYANPAYAKMLGVTSSDLIGRSPRDFTLDTTTLNEAFENRKQGKRTTYESILEHSDGSPVNTYITGVPIYEESEFSGSISVITDVTEHKNTEQALRQSENLFRLMFDASPIGIAICNNAGEFLRVNTAFSEITGYTDIKACFVQDLLSLEDDEDKLTELISGELEALQAEADCKLACGGNAALLVHGANLNNDEVPVLFQIIDITEKKALEQRLRNSQKLEALGRLAGGIAHDFNNILTAISGYAELLAFTLGDTDPQVKRDIEKIFTAAARATDLTNKLLAFSRRRSFQAAVVDVNDSIISVQMMFERLAGDSISVVANLLDKPCLVKTDPGQLEQVILNLLINARDAMPNGGEIEIYTSLVTKRDGVRNITLSVKDTGYWYK